MAAGQLHRLVRLVYFPYHYGASETAVSFEFDEAKSQSNKAKHGIDFVEAQALWRDDMFIEIPARSQDEPRFVVIGMIAGQHWSAVITYREDRIRIISVRRSRDEEVVLHEG
jgi:uncharacterized DUF497 family protein